MLPEVRMKPVGKPDAANRHVRFDERGWKTGRRFRQHPRPSATLLQANLEVEMIDVSAINVTTVSIIIVVIYVLSSIKILREYERGVIFRLGRVLPQPKGPGIILVFAPIDRMVRISLRVELKRSSRWPTSSTPRRNWPRRRFAACWVRWNWTCC
jgi:hypothetical protein